MCKDVSRGILILAAAVAFPVCLINCSGSDTTDPPLLGGNPALSVNASTLVIPEGEIGQVRLFLTAEPASTATATAEIVEASSPISIAGASEFQFDAENWDVAQTLTVAASTDVDSTNDEAQLRLTLAGGQDMVMVRVIQQDASGEPVAPPTYSSLADWAEGTQDRDDGATRDFYNRAANLRWKNALGDYSDADGIEQGSTPFASASIVDDDSPRYIDLDVTSLVAAWVSGTHANQGMIVTSPSGTFKLYSREHSDENQRPELVVTTGSGTSSKNPVADTHLSASTFQGFGDTGFLRLSDSTPALIRFDLSDLAGETVNSATLRLYVYEFYGNGTAQVFRCSQSHAVPEVAPATGLADAYPADAGIGAHADVYLFEDFESADWQDKWSYVKRPDAEGFGPVDSDPDHGFIAHQGKALRTVMRTGPAESSASSLNMLYLFMEETGSEPLEAHLRYYLRISRDWYPNDGGKLPGIAGTYDTAGWGGGTSDGTNGWSVRGAFMANAPAGNPAANLTGIGNYSYYTDQPGIFGDVWPWRDGYRGLLEKDRWYCIELYVKLNDPALHDGIVRGWVDGQPAFERLGLSFRTVDTLRIDRIWMNIYHGGVDPVPQDSYAYVDNIVIAKSYIGPMKAAAGE